MRKFLVCTAIALALAACASTPQQAPSTAKASMPVGCVGTTATRLPVDPNSCPGFGSQYSKQDLDRTGQPYVGDSLRMLDPAIQTHGGVAAAARVRLYDEQQRFVGIGNTDAAGAVRPRRLLNLP